LACAIFCCPPDAYPLPTARLFRATWATEEKGHGRPEPPFPYLAMIIHCSQKLAAKLPGVSSVPLDETSPLGSWHGHLLTLDSSSTAAKK